MRGMTEGRRTKKIICFFLVCLLLQGGVRLIVSEPFARRLYYADARFHAERVTPNDESVLEYYAMREQAAEAEVIVLGFDAETTGSALLVLDWLEFIKRCTNVRQLVVDMPAREVTLLNYYLNGDDAPPEETLSGCAGATEETVLLIEGLCELNAQLPPARKITLLSEAEAGRQRGERGSAVLYLADRSLGAADAAETAEMLGATACLTVDLRRLEEFPIPLAGEAGTVWLLNRRGYRWTAAFYDYVVTQTRGGRAAALARKLTAPGEDYVLLLVGASDAEPLP